MKAKLLSAFDELVADGQAVIGNDLVYVPDFKHSLSEAFKAKVYTANEIGYCDSFADSTLRYASTWAAKEAIYKAVKQLNPAPVGWKQIEIIRQKAAGKPKALLHFALQKYMVSLTITHDGDYVWAAALVSSH